MASQYVRLLDSRTLNANDAMLERDAVDLGAYRIIVAQIRMGKVGTAGNILLETSLTNEPGTFVAIPNVTWAANVATPAVLVGEAFGRYVRWKADNAVAGSPVVTIDVLAKE